MALFDFDGSLSLIRTGWMQVMVPMMIEILAELKTGETEDELRAVIEDFVWRLTGQETVYQMMELANQVKLRGGAPLDPLVYKQQYLEAPVARDRRPPRSAPQRQVLRRTRTSCPARAPCSKSCSARGLRLYLASGTDEIYMKEEADLLDVSRYFDGGVYGALDDFAKFSKRILIQRILQSPDIQGDQLIGFGDGYVEIEEVKQVGGVGVGLATDEPECRVAGPVEAPAPDRSRRRLHHPQLPLLSGAAGRTRLLRLH